MSYATPAHLRQWISQDRVNIYAPGPETTDNARLQDALDVASAEMDGAFQLGGYSVPVDVVTNPLAAERALLLRRHCMALALDTLKLSLDGLPESITSHVAASRRWLRDIRGLRAPGGKAAAYFAELPGLSRAS